MASTTSKYSNTEADVKATDSFNAFMVSKGAFAVTPEGSVYIVPDKWHLVSKLQEEYKQSLRTK